MLFYKLVLIPYFFCLCILVAPQKLLSQSMQSPMPLFNIIGVAAGFPSSFQALNSPYPTTYYHWDFGDGTLTTTTIPIISHTYISAGFFYVSLMITNSEDASTYVDPSLMASQLLHIPPSSLNTPIISNISPNTGSLKGGTPVTIIGNYFLTTVEVLFGSKPAKKIITQSPYSIIAIAPPGLAGPVNITVITSLGYSISPSITFNYIFIPPPIPPSHFKGKIIKGHLKDSPEYIYHLTWNPSSDSTTVGYLLYRNDKFIAHIPSTGPYTFDDRRKKEKKSVYTLTGFNLSGDQSIPLTFTLP